MTRAALALLLAITGCDRVFGLIGDDTPAGEDAPQRNDATGGDDAEHPPPGQPFCSVNPGALFCIDFDAAAPFEVLSPGAENGTIDVSLEQAQSGVHSLKSQILFSSVGTDSKPYAIAVREIETADPQITYELSVYIPAVPANDMAIFEISTGLATTRLFMSGTFTSQTDDLVFTSDHPVVIPRDSWVPLQVVFTNGVVDVQSGTATAEELEVAPGEPANDATIGLGLQESTTPSDRNQQDLVVYYDDVLVK